MLRPKTVILNAKGFYADISIAARKETVLPLPYIQPTYVSY